MPRIVGGQSPKCKVQTEFTFLWAYLLRRPFSLQRLKVVWGSCCHQRCKQCLTIFNKRRYKYPHKWVVSRVPTLSGLNLLRCAKLYIACMSGRHCFCIFPSMMNGFPGEVWNHYSELTLRQSGAGSGDACLSGGHQPALLCAELLHFCPTFVIFKHRKLMAPLFAPLFTTLPFYQAQGRAGCGSQLYRHSFYLFKACEHS